MLVPCQNQLLSFRCPPTNVARWKPGFVLTAADGMSNSGVAHKVGVSRTTVILWCQRFLRGGPVALTKIALPAGAGE